MKITLIEALFKVLAICIFLTTLFILEGKRAGKVLDVLLEGL